MSNFLRAGAAFAEFFDTERVVGEEKGRVETDEGRVEMAEGPELVMLPF